MFNIRLLHTGQRLDLLPSTEIRVEGTNPMFDSDSIPRIYTFPFRLPKTPRNRSALSNADRIDVKPESIAERWPAVLQVAGVDWASGYLTVKDRTETTINVQFEGGALEFVREVQATDCNEIDIDTVTTTLPSGTYTLEFEPKIIAGGSWGARFYFRVDDKEYETTGNSSSSDVATAMAALINADFPSMASVSGNILTLTSTTYYEWSNYSRDIAIGGLIELDPSSPNFGPPSVLYNQYEIDQDVRTVSWDLLGWAPPVVGWINANGTDVIRSEETPGILVEKMLKSIEVFGAPLKVSGSFLDDTELQTLMSWTGWSPVEPVTFARLDASSEIFEASYGTIKTPFNVGEALPAVPIKEYLDAIRNTFCVSYYPQDTNLEVRLNREVLKTDIEDWTGKEDATYKFVPAQEQGVTFRFAESSIDDLSRPSQQRELKLGDGNIKIQVASTLFRDAFTAYNLAFQMPLVSIDTPWVDDSEKRFEDFTDIRFLFVREKVAAWLYASPFAELDGAVPEPSFNYELTLEGSKSLYEKFWKEYINLIRFGKEIERRINLSLAELLNLRKFDKPRKLLKSKNGNMLGVVKSFKFKLSNERRGIPPVDITFITEETPR